MRRALALLALVPLAAACGTDAPDAATERRAAPVVSELVSIAPPVLAPEVQEHIDQGNTAFELEDWAGALEHYEAAVAADEASAAGWFGVFMALTELGDTARAEEARARVEALAQPMPGDPHATGTTTTEDMPLQGGGA